ncbi:histidine--tRNA ligase [Candidatus Micrarchaeota archaeon]|nr:MAG: histidine--tRNA ligase [Candidatus Micrarchaeota archaeon]
MRLSIPKGTRDFSPEEMRIREYVISKIKEVFERYGFEALETPAVEFLDVLMKKYGEEEKLIWKFKDLGGRDVALRFDLTVPLARYVAMNRNMPVPFKRYQISRVWRYDQPQKGRYREFWQCDVDIVGSKSVLADAEIIAITNDVLKAVGFKSFEIRINNRKLMSEIYKKLGIENEKDIFVAVDKIDKIGEMGVIDELKKRGVDDAKVKEIMDIIKIKGKPKKVLDRVKDYVSKETVGESEDFFEAVKLFGVPDEVISFDLSLARGLDYYTSFVFETVVKEGQVGSITGGGRYDKLIGLFAGKELPATGTTIGLERIIDAMKDMKMLPKLPSKTAVFIASATDEVRKESIKICQKLRKQGINCDIDLMDRKLKKQMDYASSKQIPFCLIVGPKEINEKIFTLRDMRKGKEYRKSIEEIVEFLNQEKSRSED